MDVYNEYVINHKGRDLKVQYIHDDMSDHPWETSDGHGVVRKSTRSHSRNGSSDKRPSERPLNNADYNDWQFYYDWQASMEKARSEGWGLSQDALEALERRLKRKPTKGQILHEAVERDFKHLRGWCRDDWHWMGVRVTDVETGVSDSLWGIESNADEYIEQVVEELCEQIYLPTVKAIIEAA